MAHNPRFTALHREEDRFRPRFARAFVKWARTMKKTVDRRAVIRAIKARDIKAVQELYRSRQTEAPLRAILRDVRERGRNLVRSGRV